MIRVLTNDGLQKGAINKLTSLGFEVVNNHYEKDVLGTTLKEFDILVLLIMNPKRVFTKEQIYQHIYNDVEIEVDNRVYGLVKNLRKKIEERPEAPRYIQTVRGVGYRFRA